MISTWSEHRLEFLTEGWNLKISEQAKSFPRAKRKTKGDTNKAVREQHNKSDLNSLLICL